MSGQSKDLEKVVQPTNTTANLKSPSDQTLNNNSSSDDEFKGLQREQLIADGDFRSDLVKSEAPFFPFVAVHFRKGHPSLNETATQPSVYDDPALSKYFRPTEKYENLHRFDPDERWTWAEELPLVNKIDWRITLFACVAFFGLDLGRGNIQQANTQNFLPSLGMNRNDYNLGNTVYQVSFLLAELPSQMVSKTIGPDRWIPFIMCSWSIVSACQFFLTGRPSFLVTRALLGLLQGGFIPDMVLYLSYFFKAGELPLRLAAFWTVRRVTDIVAPLLAFGVLRLDGLHGREGWRWLFLIEGCIMLSIGVWAVFTMTASPTQTKAPWRPNGWFNEREEKIMTNRILRDDPSKGDMHNRQAITPKLLWKALADYDLWPFIILGLLWEMPAGPPDQYLTLNLRDLGFDTFDANLLTIPAQFFGAITMIVMTYMTERFNERTAFGIFTQFWYLPNLIALITLPAAVNPWAKFAVLTVLLSYPSPHPMHVSWASRNANSVRTRAVVAATYNMSVQLGRVIYSNVYRDDDQPLYRRGNTALAGIAAMNIILYVLIKIWYIWRNKSRAKKWDAMTEEERTHYLDTTKDTGAKRLDVRFLH